MLLYPLYLASASPRRHEILKQIGIQHMILRPPALHDEDEPIYANETATQYVQRTALEKLKHAVSWRETQSHIEPLWPILTADTTVEYEGHIIGKPTDKADSYRILQLLSGACHQVHTAACLYFLGNYYSCLSSTAIEFDQLNPSDIRNYCESGDPIGKAGAYGIQGLGAIFIKKITGSYSGVMGLDIYQTHQLFVKAGLKQTTA